MALPASGAISLGQVQTEFGGASPATISEYYRAGVNVPTSQTNIPTSGAISLSNFHGTANEQVVTVTQSFWGSYAGYALAGHTPHGTNPAFGSVSPNDLNGYLIASCTQYSNGYFYFRVMGTHAQSYFTTIKPANRAILYTASAAGFGYISGATQWYWLVPIFMGTSGTQTFTIIDT